MVSTLYGGGSGSRVAATTTENASGLEVIYPNPSDDQAQVRYSLGAACPVSFEVVNQVGQTLRVYNAGLQQAGQHSQSINTSDLTEGQYTLKMAAADLVQSKHLLIQRKK
ncbi:MAG: T9SS type A sorting domain-containing protein [Cytophagaceae bacterium]|nr:MAG: T9SS type A sorting domain-containing protein [Cytophagaceae bacterium]